MRQRKITGWKYSDSNRTHPKFVVNYREAGNPERTLFATKETAADFARLKNEKVKRTGIATSTGDARALPRLKIFSKASYARQALAPLVRRAR